MKIDIYTAPECNVIQIMGMEKICLSTQMTIAAPEYGDGDPSLE